MLESRVPVAFEASIRACLTDDADGTTRLPHGTLGIVLVPCWSEPADAKAAAMEVILDAVMRQVVAP